MANLKTEETVDPGDDDQWLYGDSNLNLDPLGTPVEDVKPIAEPVGVVEDEVLNILLLLYYLSLTSENTITICFYI